MPEASGTGMRDMPRSNQPVAPAITMSTADTRNAPIMAGIGNPTALVARSAAPGVDQAVTTGTRYRSDSFEQAFSPDDGKTWEMNWIADDTRVK